jgi:hypothetical protein
MLATRHGTSIERQLGELAIGGNVRVFDAAFDFFNQQLFDGLLPAMNIHFSHMTRMTGFYCPGAWLGGEEEDIAEIIMNPAVLQLPVHEALSILVHKMCHYWQFGYGSPSRATNHNREWSQKMLEVGLLADTATQQGVRLPGQRVGHTIRAGGPFERACAAMPRELLLPWKTAVNRAENLPLTTS